MDIPSWIESALQQLKTMKVLHHHYVANVRQVQLAFLATMPGEVITLVGPSRVGKSKSLSDAIASAFPTNSRYHKPVVVVEAENEGKNGEFSTKAFMVRCLRAIEHPIFGEASIDDPIIQRTAERILRDAFEAALIACGTLVFVVDEAQQIGYAPGGPPAAARILNSLKCLANKTRVMLVLAGSYELLDLIALAPHLLGRQQPLEFPRYRASNPEDVAYWKQLLLAFNQGLVFEKKGESLQKWGKLLFEGSFGCAGHLSRWLRNCLAYTASNYLPYISEASFQATRIPDIQAKELAAEILAGERTIARTGHAPSSLDGSARASKGLAKRPSKPFQRNPRRSPRGGRS